VDDAVAGLNVGGDDLAPSMYQLPSCEVISALSPLTIVIISIAVTAAASSSPA
jgi:hypothetical protein